jgi:DNA-binding CsgD family transcriptional regulator
MNREFNSSVLIKNLEQNSSIAISGKILLNKSHYLIIDNGNFQVNTLSDFNDEFCSLIVGNLEINGKSYCVVKTQDSTEKDESGLVNLLTERELQIATLAALGRSNKQIAYHLRISDCTVSAHLRRIFIKLDVDSRAAMVYRCAALIDRLQQLGDRFHQND